MPSLMGLLLISKSRPQSSKPAREFSRLEWRNVSAFVPQSPGKLWLPSLLLPSHWSLLPPDGSRKPSAIWKPSAVDSLFFPILIKICTALPLCINSPDLYHVWPLSHESTHLFVVVASGRCLDCPVGCGSPPFRASEPTPARSQQASPPPPNPHQNQSQASFLCG